MRSRQNRVGLRSISLRESSIYSRKRWIGALELVQNKESKKPFDASVAAGALGADVAFDSARGGDALAICPPLIIEDKQIDQLFDRRSSTLDQTQAQLGQRGVL
jgi:4-aminobutyrate---pyruvate transaminase